MKEKIVALILILSLAGCALTEAPHVQGICRHNALCNAIVWQNLEGKNVRICTGNTPTGGHHAQAQALVGGQWLWLNEYGDGVVWADDMQQSFEPDGKPWNIDAFYVLCVGAKP